MKQRLDFVTNSSSTAYILLIEQEIPEKDMYQLTKIDKNMSVDDMLSIFSKFSWDCGILEYNEEAKAFLESVDTETKWKFLKIFVNEDLLKHIHNNENLYYTIVDRDNYPFFFENYTGKIIDSATDL